MKNRRLAQRFSDLVPSCTLELKQKADRRRAAGLPVFDFGLGENTFPLPDSLTEAAVRAARSGETGYPHPAGLPELRNAVLRWLGLQDEYQIENVVVSCGAKQAILNSMLAVCNPGDTVLTAAAPWVSYAPIALCCALDCRPAAAGPDLKTSREALLEAIQETPRARIFLLNNPCNPSGKLYSEQEVAELLELCANHGIYFMLDRLYWKILFDGRKYPEPPIGEHTKPWLIQIDGLSKNFCKLGGLRVGWSVAPKDVSELISSIQSHHSAGTSVLSQQIAAAALGDPRSTDTAKQLQQHRDCLQAAAAGIPHVQIAETEGTYYSFWDVRGAFGRSAPEGAVLKNSVDVAEYLVEKHGVVTAPGSAFAQEGWLRLSFAVPQSVITEGMAVARRAFELLQN